MVKLISEETKLLFPLKTIDSVETLFKTEIQKEEPNIALLSIVLGAIEHSLTHVLLANIPTEKSSVKSKSGKNRKSGGKKLVTSGRGSSAKSETVLKVEIKNEDEKHSKEEEEPTEVKDEKEQPVFKIETPDIDTVIEPKEKGKLEENKSVEKIDGGDAEFPPLQLDIVEALYEKFRMLILNAVDLNLYSDNENEKKEQNEKGKKLKRKGGKNVRTINQSKSTADNLQKLENIVKSTSTSRELIKNVSEVVWNNLSRSYTADKPHLQTLYTYLTGGKLDCFGVALAVVAGCQVLEFKDVNLALSEDHVWVVFGPNKELNAEVTWHGKGNEDKRGQPVGTGEDATSWLYLKGFAVICDRHMEAAAVVSSINTAINATTDSVEMSIIQQRLLWILYDAGHLQRYPMAIGNLADLEEISATKGRKLCELLFQEAIEAAKTHYNNMHVYPYIYYGAYLYRQGDFKGALKSWADAAYVIQHYSKNDEEIYKEFMEISTDYITQIMKQCSTGISAGSLTRDPHSFAKLLQFFDGICLWEESSRTPVVHIVWAKAWIHAIGKFDSSIRKRISILSSNPEIEEESKENSRKKAKAVSKLDGEENLDDDKDKGKLISTKSTRSLTRSQGQTSKGVKVCDDEADKNNKIEKAIAETPVVCDTELEVNKSVISIPTESCGEILVDPKIKPALVASDSLTAPTSSTSHSVAISTSPDSGIYDDETPMVVALHSSKMQGLKDLLQRDKFIPSALTLHFTAQSASVTFSSGQDGAGGRTRKGKLHGEVESSSSTSTSTTTGDSVVHPPPRKRVRRESKN